MAKNSFSVFASQDGIKDFLKSMIGSCDTMISHYDSVLNDISGDITDPQLEATKGPTVNFLKAMRSHWEATRADAQQKLDSL